MSNDREPGQSIPIASVPNMRDLGGWPTRDGKSVRWGLVYRSTDLTHLAGDDMAAFAALGIKTVYDLRTPVECKGQPDKLPPGTGYVTLNVLRDSKTSAPAQLYNVIDDPKNAEAMLGDGKGVALFEAGYREVATLPSGFEGYHHLFADLGTAEHRPALFHCTTGKDRTGWAAASLLMLLGVPDDLVMKEYMLTNKELLPSEQPLLDHFRSLGGDPDLLAPVVGVSPQYLEAATDEVLGRFGTIEGYFTEGLKIDKSGQDALRAALLEDA
jgi:protein-tyrosine phosphatase